VREARSEAESVHASRVRAADRELSTDRRWWGWPVESVVSTGAATLPEVLREWSLIDVWDQLWHGALARSMEA
jgi:hypothetical protein